ncbi:MAG: thiol reductant ABC exporter subunit CydD [Anaerolineae bacterium]|nr:thiol reductant ABC exporter subunit CydD [Anaerolineae bacterium]
MSVEKRILQQSQAGRQRLLGAVLVATLAAVLLIVQLILISQVVNRVFLDGSDLAKMWPWLGLLLLLALLRAIVIGAGDILAQHAASRVKSHLRQQLTNHLFLLGPLYTRAERSGELANTLVTGVEALDEYISQYLPARNLAGIVPALVFVVVLALDPWTSLVLLFAGPMLILMLALIGGRAKALTERRFAEMSWMSAFFLDMIQGLPTLKMYGRSREQAAQIGDISRQFGHTTMDVLRTAFQTSLVMEWAATAAIAMVALEVSLRLMNGMLPFDRALAVLLLTPEFFMPLRQMALKYHAGTAGKAAAERIFEVLDTPEPVVQPAALATNGHPAAIPHRFDLGFDHVGYTYDGRQRPALSSFLLTIPHGQTVALVGPTGAGKTTVSSLLLRFIEPNTGRITVGGTALSAIDRRTWRAQVAWVPQQPHLFHGTVAENIRFGRPDAGQADVVAAAQAAYAHEFIQALPQGYETVIGERGARLSGGQQQRLAIARAFLKDAPVLILDEATAHLDADSERLIRAALARLAQGRTVLVIAHRLQMAYQADQIVVLDHGRAVEQGKHQELLNRNGQYRHLVASYQGGAL